ncbi:M23 family metallopeptidase, partial [Ectobacillus panaciterrae]|uniref:M23 family metallopeptidase n=1 Tax=Ectobacillus panaciterrae TaxID=363872 RepID=UPI00054E3BAF
MACPAPPFTIIQSPFHLYKAVPFNVPAQQIELRTPCSTNHPGRDYTFNGANFGTSVRAIESGIVEYAITSANTGNSSCICVQGDISCLQRECNPTAVGILSDGIITEYVHVEPSVTRGQVIKAGDIIGQLALRGTFVVLPGGNPLPHVHINRKRTWTGPVCQQEFICDWGIDGIDNRNPQNPPPTCSNGWSLNNNGEWMFCQNGVPQRGWFPGA